MPNRRKNTMDVRAVLVLLRAGLSDRQVAKDLGVVRVTVKRYREWADDEGLLVGALPPLDQLHPLMEKTLPVSKPPQNRSSVEVYGPLVEKLIADEVEIAAIWERLKERGFTGSYSSVYRFVRRLKPLLPDVTVRVERPAGEEAQVDFGYGGRMIDPDTGQWRRTWAFVMTLSFSRLTGVKHLSGLATIVSPVLLMVFVPLR